MAMAKEGLPVTPAVVQWARERSGYSIEDAAHHFKKIAAWEAGEALPTYVQVEDMADRFKVPVAARKVVPYAHGRGLCRYPSQGAPLLAPGPGDAAQPG
jgi:hypothetical protein